MRTVLTIFPASLSAVLLLSACVLGGGKDPYRLIEPQVEATGASERRALETTLAVSRPESDRTRDSSRILVRRDRTLLPWTGAAWIDRSPDLLQALLVTYLDGQVATVGRYGSLPAAYRLDLDMRRFELFEAPAGLKAEVVLTARLFDADGELLDGSTFSRRESGGASIDEAVAAMEAAMGALFDELADWLHAHLARRVAGEDAGGSQ